MNQYASADLHIRAQRDPGAEPRIRVDQNTLADDAPRSNEDAGTNLRASLDASLRADPRGWIDLRRRVNGGTRVDTTAVRALRCQPGRSAGVAEVGIFHDQCRDRAGIEEFGCQNDSASLGLFEKRTVAAIGEKGETVRARICQRSNLRHRDCRVAMEFSAEPFREFP